jgi:hypothetical protein
VNARIRVVLRSVVLRHRILASTRAAGDDACPWIAHRVTHFAVGALARADGAPRCPGLGPAGPRSQGHGGANTMPVTDARGGGAESGCAETGE